MVRPDHIALAQKIAIQGEKGSFHQMAAEGYFGPDINIIPCQSFSQLAKFTSEAHQTDAGIMAIENSIAGSILSNYQLLQEASLHIAGEIYLQISQHLMALPGQQATDIKEVRSHPMAIYQCRHFLKTLPDARLIETEDTAYSAREVKEKQLKGVAAIASTRAAEMYGLEIIERNIETVHNNYTRFLILSREKNQDVLSHNKASIYFGVSHEPGSLVKALKVLADHDINVSKIQSFPVIDVEWQYYFHLDIEFETSTEFEVGLKELEKYVNRLRVLGKYHKGITIT